MKDLLCVALSVCVLMVSSGASASAGSLDEINACYRNAGEDRDRIHHCLEKEFDALVTEHKDVTERVAVIAKSWDKPHRNRVRWDRLMRSNQSFKTYVRRECDFIESTTKGARIVEKNAELACKINLYRMRVDFLENRFLSAEKE